MMNSRSIYSWFGLGLHRMNIGSSRNRFTMFKGFTRRWGIRFRLWHKCRIGFIITGTVIWGQNRLMWGNINRDGRGNRKLMCRGWRGQRGNLKYRLWSCILFVSYQWRTWQLTPCFFALMFRPGQCFQIHLLILVNLFKTQRCKLWCYLIIHLF